LSLAINGSTIFAGTLDDGLFQSTNGGSWTHSGFSLQVISSLAINGNNIFAGTYYGGIFLSTNNGNSWDIVSNGLPVGLVNSLAITGSNIFAGTYGVYRSTNNGGNWTAAGLSNRGVLSFSISGNNIFAGTDSGVYLSTNNGTNWIDKNQGFNIVPIIYTLILSDDLIYAGSFGQSVWKRLLSEIQGVKQISGLVPSSFSLERNYPNPFNPNTVIRYSLTGNRFVTLKVFDVLGKEVATLVNEKQSPGTYQVEFVGSNLPSGVYFYRIIAGDFTDTKGMILLK
jgi:hypothetical protein